MDQQTDNNSNKSYNQILKSTTIIGGASIISIVLRVIRTKFLAVFLGPAGMGLIGVYESIAGVVGTFAGAGIQTSGVRQTAEAAATNDQIKIAKTIVTLRRLSLILGILGMLLLVALSKPISLLTFGSTEFVFEISILSIIIFFGAIAGGQSSLIQGMRRIRELAKLGILGALFGTIFSIPIIYVYGQKGIVPFLIAVAFMGILMSWWYARKINIIPIKMGWTDTWVEARSLLKLGIAFMLTALMTTGNFYLIRVLVVRQLGMDATGLYQAASTLSLLYVGFILDAMGKDYYPRLTAVAKDNAACNRLVNEQTEVGFLLAIPGILATLTFTPLILHFFYSIKFIAAYEILRWQILGILIRVVSWPLSYIIIAKGRMTIYFWTELVANVMLLFFTWVGILYFGLPGTGVAFFSMYLCYFLQIFIIVGRMSGFSWSSKNIRLMLLALPAVVIVFSAQYILSEFWYTLLGSIVTLAFGCLSVKCLSDILTSEKSLSIISKMKDIIRSVRTCSSHK